MSFSGETRATALVTHGLYAKLRNLIYLLVGCFIAGLFAMKQPYSSIRRRVPGLRAPDMVLSQKKRHFREPFRMTHMTPEAPDGA